MMRETRLVCLGLALLTPCLGSLPSCSLVQPMEQDVTVTTDRPAELFIGRRKVAETSASSLTTTLTLQRNESVTLTARDPGGAWGRKSINTKLSGLGILDIVGGIFFLVPFITLITGHAYELEPTRLQITLQTDTEEPPDDDFLER